MSARCLHCRVDVPDGERFCCFGCRAAHQLIAAHHLERYRTLTNDPLPPGGAPSARPWLSVDASDAIVDVQGITCGACVWVIERLAEKHRVACAVNPGIGRLDVRAEDASALGAFLDDVETLGYRTGPARKQADATMDSLVLRAGVCAALAMAATSFSFARYLGLDAADDRVIAEVFSFGEAITGALAVVVGGSVFIASSVRALRLGVVPLDLPIAAGLVLAFLGSVAALVTRSPGGVFFDSIAMFAALMLVGRLAQRSMLTRSRAQLLEDDGFGGLPVTRLVQRVPEVINAAEIVPNDTLLIRPGDAVPVASRLQSERATFSLAWITGESDARELKAGELVPAGASAIGASAVVVIATELARDSRLATLLSRSDDDAPALDARWQRFAAGSVFAVLALAIVAGFAWWSVSAARSLEVATAILVVTCPCAIGLALPLANEIASAALRRRGVFVRRPGFLDRLARVRTVVLDKTGTLTIGALALTASARSLLALLDHDDRAALFDLVARSAHPKSRALHAALAARHPALALREITVTEVAGVGVRADINGHAFALGRDRDEAAGFATSASTEDVVFTRDGAVLASFTFQEELQPDATREIIALRERGLAIHLASGDRADRSAAIGARLGLPPSAIHAEASPEQKADLVRALGAERVLFIGDGVNDVAAFAAAACAGTPALDRPQLPARADFYVVAHGVGPLSALFDAAARYRRGSRAALSFSIAYNVVAVALALAGVITPLIAAVAMPLSSIAVLVLVDGVMRAVPARRRPPAITLQTHPVVP